MGLVTSCCGRRPKKSRLHSEHDLMTTPRKKRHRRDISATYSANDFIMTLEQLNINQASEEELMTLPGISRNIARNIIQYRNHIGGFRKAEDLALVSGVGANKLGTIRMEIYCGKYDPVLGNQLTITPCSSRKSSNRLSALARQNPDLKIDVNKATQVELSKVSGIGSELAQRIVDFRSEIGQYKFLTDVSKVPEIGTYHFEKFRHYLTVDDAESVCSTVSTSMSMVENYSSDSLPLLRERPNGTVPHGFEGSRDLHATSSTQTDNSLVPPHFASMPRRKSRSRRYPSQKMGRVRLASWNLQGLSLEKVRNPGVKEVICMTLLENGLSLLACQDITDSTALDEICTELNSPTLGPVKAWSGPRGKWTCITAPSVDGYQQSKGSGGFLWDTNQGVRLLHSYSLKLASNRTISAPNTTTGVPFIGRFSFAHLPTYLSRSTTLRAELNVFNVSFERQAKDQFFGGEEAASIEAVAQTIEQYFPDKGSMVLACDAFPNGEVSDLSPLTSCGFLSVSTTRSGLSNGVQRPAGLKHTNNLLLSSDLEMYFKGTTAGSSGIVSEGLSHPLIPSGWSWGGLASNHRPTWMELIFPSS